VKNTGIYLDNTSDSIVENNEIFGTTFKAPGTTPGPAWNFGSNGIYVGLEPSSNPNLDTVRNIVRNNLIANVNDCVAINVFPAREDAGWKTGGQILGNTCLAFSGKAVDMSDPEANIAGWEIANNIFDLPNNGGASVCTATSSSKMRFHHNAWPKAPKDPSCDGNGDVVGSPYGASSFDWKRAGQGNFPAMSDWQLSTKSLISGAGAPVGSRPTALESFLQFPAISGAQKVRSHCLPPESEWRKALSLDIACRQRDPVRPSIGALEELGVTPAHYSLSVE
jgi:hypothetical protein